MTLLGIALRPAATHVALLDSGELDKEVAVECQRLGVEVIIVDRYVDASAIHVAHRSHVTNMPDGDALRRVVKLEKPHYIVPEIGAIVTGMLIQLEEGGLGIIPCACTMKLTINREGICYLAAEELQLPTSTYRFVDSEGLFRKAVATIGYPCIVKPVMSSSGKGQTFIHSAEQLAQAWEYAQQGGRAGAGRVIVEDVVKFDFEITLLTVNAVDSIYFCTPVDRRQEDGDYHEPWQPQQMSPPALEHAQEVARKVVLVLGGYGLSDVELLVCGDEVIFGEVPPRPHGTGMVALTSRDLSGFALHVRAFLGLPIGGIRQYGPAVSTAIPPQLASRNVTFDNVQNAVGVGLQIRLSGKPAINGSRRLGIMLATAESVIDAIKHTKHATGQVKIRG